MSGLDTEILYQTGDFRMYYQPGGAGPRSRLYYAGDDGEYITLETASNPRLGGIEPHNFHHPFQIRQFQQVGRNRTAPAFPTATVKFYQKRGAIPEHLWKIRRLITTYYAAAGSTNDISNFATGAEFVKVYADGEVTESAEMANTQDSNDLVADDLSYTFGRIYSTGGIALSETAALEVYSQLISGTYGPFGDGTQALYLVGNNTTASPGQAPSIFYRTEHDGNWVEQTITGAAATDVPKKILIIGQYLVVVFKDATAGGYFFTTISAKSGIPDSTGWTKVTTGFVSGRAPNDAFALSARQFFIVGDGGYIYKVRSVETGALVLDAGTITNQNLNKIRARGSVIVIGGVGDTFLISTNGGKTFSAASPGTGGAVTAVEVINGSIMWAASNTVIRFSVTGGETWHTLTLSATIAAIQEIVFVTPECGYILTATSDPEATVYCTLNGGVDWITGQPRLFNFPVFDRANQVVFPYTGDNSADTTHIMLVGLAGNGSDGIALTGFPNSS